eukprot:Nk52_evm8s249 gene=Nk52_evmTU8s249
MKDQDALSVNVSKGPPTVKRGGQGAPKNGNFGLKRIVKYTRSDHSKLSLTSYWATFNSLVIISIYV